MFFTNQNAEIVACILLFRKSRHKPNLESTSKYGFPPIWGEYGGVLSMGMEVILDYLVSPFMRRKKGEFRDWTIDMCCYKLFYILEEDDFAIGSLINVLKHSLSGFTSRKFAD